MSEEKRESKESTASESIASISAAEYKRLLDLPLAELVEKSENADELSRRALEFINKRGYQYQELPALDKVAYISNPERYLLDIPLKNPELIAKVKGFFTPPIEGGACVPWQSMRELMRDAGAKIVERHAVTDMIFWMEETLRNVTEKAISLAAGKEIDVEIMARAITSVDPKYKFENMQHA